MYLIPQPETGSQTQKFKLQGFPEEASVALALENFYRGQTVLPREVVINNMFDELIFSGTMDQSGRVARLESKERKEDIGKHKYQDKKEE